MRLPARLLVRGTFIDVIFAESHHGNNATVRMTGAVVKPIFFIVKRQ